MSANKIRIEGLEQLVQKLGSLQAGNFLQGIMRAAAIRVRSKAQRYPPSTSANIPKPYPGRWYQRGFGARWALAGGGAGGRRTSQRLGTRWYARVSSTRAEIGNTAGYAPFVQGDQQARALRRIGWKKLEDIGRAELPGIERDMQKEVERKLK